MELAHEPLPVQNLLDFRKRWTLAEKYRVAANLWSSGGLSWEASLKIAEDAFKEERGSR